MEKNFIMANPQPGEFEFTCSENIKHNMSVAEYEELLAKETEIGHKLFDTVRSDGLPLLVSKVGTLLSGTSEAEPNERVFQIFPVLNRVLSMMSDGLHLQIIKGMISWSCGEACTYGNTPSERFSSLCTKQGRQAFWGTEWELPLYLVKGMILDLEHGVTASEFKMSHVIDVARKYGCSEEIIETIVSA